MKFIVTETRRDTGRTWYVAAKPGWMRCASGAMARDGSFAGGPEWTLNRSHALEFDTRLKAARVRGKCPSATVEALLLLSSSTRLILTRLINNKRRPGDL